MNFDYSLIDIFGIAISLRYLQKDQYQTKFGAMVTIIIGALIIIQAVLVGKELFLKENPSVIFSERFVASPQRFTMKKDNFNFAIGIQHPGNYSQFIDESIYTVSAQLSTMKKIFNTTTQEYEQIWDSQIIPAGPCTPDHFGVETTKEYFATLSGLDQLYCLDQESKDIYAEGNFDQDQYANVQIVFNMCSGSDKCRPPKEIVDALTNSFVAIYMNDIIINPKKIDPFTYVGRDFFWNISPVFPKDVYLYFRNIYIESDKGVFFEQKSYDHKTSYSMQTESIIFAENTYLFSIVLRLEKAKESVYNRTYQKLSDVLAQIGGIAKALIMIGFVICMPVNQLSLNQQISNSLFSFKEFRPEQALTNGKTLTPGQQLTKMIELGKQKIQKSNQQLSQKQLPSPINHIFSGQTQLSPPSWQINNTDGHTLKKEISHNVECGQEEDQKIELIEFDQISEKDIYTTQNIISNENYTKTIENKLKTNHKSDNQRHQQLSDFFNTNPLSNTHNHDISFNIKPGKQLNVSNNTEQNEQVSSHQPPVSSQKAGEYKQNEKEKENQYPNENNIMDLISIQMKEKKEEEVQQRPAQLFAQQKINNNGIINYENDSQKCISNQNNYSEQGEKQVRELSSRRISRKQSTRIVRGIFHEAESSNDGLNLKWSDYLKYYVWPFGTFQNTKKKIDFSVDKIYQHLDMLFIIKKLSELERLKTILLDDDQVKLLQFLPKPHINLEEIEKNPNKQKQNSKSSSSDSAYPHQTNSFLDDKDLKQSEKDKAKDAFQSLKNIIKKPILTGIDKKIIEMLDPTILDNIQNNLQYIRELDSVDNDEDLINGGEIQHDPYFNNQYGEKKQSGEDQEQNGKDQEEQLQKQQLKQDEQKQIEVLTENSIDDNNTNNKDIVIEMSRQKNNSIEKHYNDQYQENNIYPQERLKEQEQQIQQQQTGMVDEKTKQSASNNIIFGKHNNLQPESDNYLFHLSSQRQPLSQVNVVTGRQSEASQPIIPSS